MPKKIVRTKIKLNGIEQTKLLRTTQNTFRIGLTDENCKWTEFMHKF